mmetsp:Transcript_36689/g.60434  ORF Transcript_36689/g.60434 Transcript_36689/m.60434 type:complete len:280 (+) Transcript_36689:1-840(+)
MNGNVLTMAESKGEDKILPARRRAEEKKREQEQWRNFEGGSEAGRLLSNIYGGGTKPKVDYPALKTKQRDPSGPFIPGGGKHGVDARETRGIRDAKVAVPKFTNKVSGPAMSKIDYHRGKIRTGVDAQNKIDAIQLQRDCYRPPVRAAVSTEEEKARAADLFAYGGGRGLPEELTQVPGPTPAEVRAQHQARLEAAAAAGEGGSAAAKPRDPTDEMFDQIYGEILERRRFLEQMEGLGMRARYEAQVTAEISQRVAELKKIDKKKTADMNVAHQAFDDG